jgi:hypothetical protein
MRGLRRGFGQTPDVTSTITYLGEPDLSNLPLTGPYTANPLQTLAYTAPFGTAPSGAPPTTTPTPGIPGTLSATQWINKNAVTVAIGAAVFLVVWKAASR